MSQFENKEQQDKFDAHVKDTAKSAVETTVADATKGLAKSEDVNANTDKLDASGKKITELENKVNTITEQGKKKLVAKTIKGELSVISDGLKDMIADKNHRGFTIKATSTYTPSAGANSAPYRDDRQEEIEYAPHQDSIVSHFMQRTGTGGAYRLNTKTGGVDNSAGKTKGSAFGRTTKLVNDDHIPYITVGHVLTVPKEELNDTNQLEAYFREEMFMEIVDTLNSQSLTGNGSAGNLQGLTNWSAVKTQATFETLYGGLADSYGTGASGANDIDVVNATQASLKRLNFLGKQYIIVNPEQIAQFQKLKATTGEYLLRTVMTPEGTIRMFLQGVEVIESSAVTAGSFHQFEERAVKWVTREGMNLEIGYDTDDWSRNNVSLKAYGRYALVSGNPTGIVNGSFANAISALNT